MTHDKLVESHSLLMATYIESMKRPRTEVSTTVTDLQNTPVPLALHTGESGRVGGTLAMPAYSRSDYLGIRFWTKGEWFEFESRTKDLSNPGSKAST